MLSLHEHYQFMRTITETTTKIIELNADILDHVIKNCEEEVSGLFGVVMLAILKEMKEKLTLPTEMAEKIEGYFNQFTVKEVPFCQKLLDSCKDDLKAKIMKSTNENITATMREELLQIKLVGKEDELHASHDKLKSEIAEMEQGLNIATEVIQVPVKAKLELLLLHGVEKILKNEFKVDVKIEPAKNIITIKGIAKQVLSALRRAYQMCNLIKEDSVDLNEMERRFLESGMLAVVNSDMKASELKGMVSLGESNRNNKAKVFVLGGATTNDVQAYLKSYMFQRDYVLDEESLTLLKSNKWKEFCNNVETKSSVMIHASGGTKISLIGEKQEVEETFTKLHEFMKRNTILKETIDMEEGYALYLSKYCGNDLREIEKELQEQSVRVHDVVEEGPMKIDGTKDGIKKARKFIHEIISNIATDKVCFDKPRMHEYLKSEEGKVFIEGIESKNKCLIRLSEDDGRASTNISSMQHRAQPPSLTSKLLCSYETKEKITFMVFKGDITAHRCDVIVNAANEDLKHIGGVAKSILDAGGKEIQKECDDHVKTKGKVYEGQCFNGSPGRLPCKRLIHAVGPHWDSRNREKVCNILRVTCLRVLEEAMSYRSIALPAIASGVFGIPKDVCAEVMIKAAEEFSKKYSSSALKEIHFVNNDDRSGQAFATILRQRFSESSSFRSNKSSTSSSRSGILKPQFYRHINERNRQSNPQDDGLQGPKRGDSIETKEGLKISVVVGDLSTHKVSIYR
jgi:poly [ADP-ribose] polymerase 10/14/15